MRVVATFHPPSGVEHSVKCSLTNDADLEHLIVAKASRLDVYSVQPHGLKHECGLDVWGHIVSLRAITSGPNSLQSNLLVLTDHPDAKLILLAYNVNDGAVTLETKQHISLQDLASRHSEFVNDIIVHPSGKVAVVCCYTGKLRIVVFKGGKIDHDYDVIIRELNLLAICFISGPETSHILAMINLDHKQRLQLLCRSLDISNQEISAEPDPIIPSTVLSQNILPSLDTPPSLVPVPPYTTPTEDEDGHSPSHLGGVLIFGGRKVLFFEHLSGDKVEISKGKQQRQAKRLTSGVQSEVQKAKEKEKQREAKRAKPRWSVKWPWSDVAASCSVDDEGRRYLIGDEFGRLAMLAFTDSFGLILLPLGETSPPTALTYLTSQHLYLGSRLGPPQLLRIHTSPYSELHEDTLPVPKGITTVPPSALSSSGKGKQKATDNGSDELPTSSSKEGVIVLGKGSYIEAVESFENIGPIWDATLADLDGTGQPQIITCSGGRNKGSLNIVRTGADFHEFASIHGITGLVNVWPVRSRFEDSTDSYLVASTLYETYVFRLDDKNSVTHLDPSTTGFITSSQTLTISNIRERKVKTVGGRNVSSYEDSSLVVQVTPSALRLLEYDPTLRLFSVKGLGWTPSSLGGLNRTIVAADINASQIVLGLSGGKLVLLTLSDNASFQVMHSPRDFPDEIAAVSCAPFDLTKNYTLQLAVSFWGSNKVAILSLESKQTYLTTIFETDSLSCLPRSLLLHNFGSGRKSKDADYHPHLLVGGNNGSLMSYVFRDSALKDMKVYPLGDTPVYLSTCNVDGKNAVFASGGRAAVFYWDRQRLQRSNVMLKDLVRGTSLNTSYFPSSLIVATTTGLLIGKVRGVDKMQIKTTALGLDNPRRIAHCPSLKVVGVITKRTVPSRIGEENDTTSSFKVLEESSFDQIAEWIFSADQELSAVLSLPDGEDGRSPCFCVGSVNYRKEEVEPSSGRIMLFSLSPSEGSVRSPENTLRMVATEEAPGCVYALAYTRGMIVAAVNTSVILYKLGIANDSSVVLEKAYQWDHNYITLNLVARGDYLVVGDAINSVSVLEIDGTKLKCIARDYSPLWPVSIDATASGDIIGANSDCNLFSFSILRNNPTPLLEKDGNYYLGEIVNKILPGRLGTTDVPAKPALEPEHLFFTSTGRIGVVLRMANDFALTMTALQRNLGDVIKGPGDTYHSSWRAPANFRGRSDAEISSGFLDGDFLENYFTYPDQEKVLAGDNEAKRIASPQNVIEAVLEELQSLH